MALLVTGQLFTWGVGDYGKLGHGDTTPQLLPRHLEYFRLMKLVYCSGGAFCSAACTDTGQIYTWGGGTYGKLGQSDTMNSLTPRPVKNQGSSAHFVQASRAAQGPHLGSPPALSSTRHPPPASCPPPSTHPPAHTALNDTPPPTMRSLGHSTAASSDPALLPPTPLPLPPARTHPLPALPVVAQVECGTFHTIALSKLGDIYSFGFNGNGRLGLAEPNSGGDTQQRNTPCLIKSFATQGKQDHDDSGLPTDDSQAATVALVKALRPRRVKMLCLGGFHSAALSDQVPLNSRYIPRYIPVRCITAALADQVPLHGRRMAVT